MHFDASYQSVADAVLDELRRYSGEAYAVPFVTGVDRDRLAIAIQRAVEHKLAGGCQHEEPCKE